MAMLKLYASALPYDILMFQSIIAIW